MASLTANAIQTIFSGGDVSLPVVQMSGVRKVASDNKVDRYRLVLSDGAYSMQAVLGTQLNQMILNNELPNYCIIILRKFICNTVQLNRKVLIVLDLQVVDTNQTTKLGNPVSIEGQTQQAAAAIANNGGVAPSPAVAPVADSAPAPVKSVYDSYPQPAAPQQPQHTPYQQQPQQQQQQQQQPQYDAYPPKQASASASAAASSAFDNPLRNGSGSSSSSSASTSNLSAPMRQQNVIPRASLSNDEFVNVFAITSLNPYQNRWTIKARVSSRSDLKTYQNQRGTGQLFNFDLIDETGEIRVCCFNDVAKRFSDMIQTGMVYYISKGTLSAAKKPFNMLKHEYEIRLDNQSIVKPCQDNADAIPTIRYSFVSISDLDNVEKDSAVDILAVVRSVEELGSITTKTTQKTLPKRNINLVDSSGRQVQLTLWNNHAETFHPEGNPVVAIKNVRVSDFNGRSLSTINTSAIQLDPDVAGARELHQWYQTQGKAANFKSMSEGGSGGGHHGAEPYKTLQQAKLENLGSGDKPDFFSNRCYITALRTETISYMACPTENCNKKVNEETPGTYFCEKCRRSFDRIDYRYVLSATVQDVTSQSYVSIFNETGQQILKHTAEEMEHFKANDKTQFGLAMHDATFRPYNISFRAKMESFNGEDRIKFSVVRATPVNFVTDSAEIIRAVRAQFGL